MKADWGKLKNKKMVPEVLKAEAIMHAGWNMATHAQLPLEKMALPFGKLQMRLAFHLLQKKGREMVQYKDMAEIKEKFAKDIVNVTTNPEQSSQAAASSDDKSSVKALAEATDAKAIALQAHKHIKLGGHYTFKNETKIWLLTDVTDERVKLVHRPFFEPEERKEVLHKDLKILKEWTKQVPHLVGDAVRSKMLPCASPFMQEELAKARAQVALYEKFQEHLNCITVLWQRWLLNVLLKCLCVMFCALFQHQDWRRGCAGFQSEPDLCWQQDQQGQAVTASYGLLASSLC